MARSTSARVMGRRTRSVCSGMESLRDELAVVPSYRIQCLRFFQQNKGGRNPLRLRSMFLIPFIKKPDWRKPPLITLALILVNVIVFAMFQSGDGKLRQQALSFYLDSALPAIELPRYASYLRDSGRPEEAQEIDGARARRTTLAYALLHMEADDAFMEELHAGRV